MDNTLFHNLDLFSQGLLVFLASLARYLVFSGGAWLVFYIFLRKSSARFRIQEKFPEPSMIRMEIGWSLSTFAIFGAMAILIGWMQSKGWTLIYLHFNDYPAWWFWLSIPAMLLLHDTWFYWSHRFMHLKKVFPLVHRIHHLSNNPTPWAAFSFHPIEAVIEAGILPLIALLIPAHPVAILIFLVIMTIMNVVGHLGYELLPSGFTKWYITRMSNTSTHHNMHHRLVKCNYGLYFNIWDRIMGTNHEKYHEQFEEITAKRKTKNQN